MWLVWILVSLTAKPFHCFPIVARNLHTNPIPVITHRDRNGMVDVESVLHPVVARERLMGHSRLFTEHRCVVLAAGQSTTNETTKRSWLGRLGNVLSFPVRIVYRTIRRILPTRSKSATEAMDVPTRNKRRLFSTRNTTAVEIKNASVNRADGSSSTGSRRVVPRLATLKAVNVGEKERQLNETSIVAAEASQRNMVSDIENDLEQPGAGSVDEVINGDALEEPVFPKTMGRSATPARGVDLSGKWDIIVSEEFKNDYDRYLTLLGQSVLVRSVALSIVGMTTEETVQSENGKVLFIRGRNVRGTWDRTLRTTGRESIVTADGEEVQAEAWWEAGKIHQSWLRGVKKYGGGDFESKRYLEAGGTVLVCESTFHPSHESREEARITWRFQRQSTST